MPKISSPAEELLACQEELCSVKLGDTAFRQCWPVAIVYCALTFGMNPDQIMGRICQYDWKIK
jgi:hypothetical protein